MNGFAFARTVMEGSYNEQKKRPEEDEPTARRDSAGVLHAPAPPAPQQRLGVEHAGIRGDERQEGRQVTADAGAAAVRTTIRPSPISLLNLPFMKIPPPYHAITS